MREKAFRRHQLQKKKKLARKIYPHDPKATNANHLATCSCMACGNPRKHWNEDTMQEKKAELAFVAQMVEATGSNSV